MRPFFPIDMKLCEHNGGNLLNLHAKGQVCAPPRGGEVDVEAFGKAREGGGLEPSVRRQFWSS